MPEQDPPDVIVVVDPANRQPALSRAAFDSLRIMGMPISEAREFRNSLIDIRTPKLIAAGTMTYVGLQFSISPTAQFNTLVMWSRRNEVGFAYPVVRANKTNTATTSLADAAAVEAFYAASETAVRAFLDEGNALKSQVNALATSAEVAAFVDPR